MPAREPFGCGQKRAWTGNVCELSSDEEASDDGETAGESSRGSEETADESSEENEETDY